ncbi:hypothetical protein GCM10010345_31470 [Streptomyces canarius]|uniref:Glycoside hydrolase family 29 N-terminal domain-containing protein n=1 Tax=Streptomyces canarius TaxID=285453 RepID=A0ABQ3CLT4_9ACTN|nr:hypothetical protein GCM10010345_31470 [Streptomyces canarius]
MVPRRQTCDRAVHRVGAPGDPRPESLQPLRRFDGEWERTEEQWGLGAPAARILAGNPHHTSVRRLVRYFMETIGAGGNPLLDVGPRKDGTIQAEQAEQTEHWRTVA